LLAASIVFFMATGDLQNDQIEASFDADGEIESKLSELLNSSEAIK
jgi:hypothetical protein